MTDDLQDLYQEVILEHSQRPRNFGRLPRFNHSAEGHNPLCGDHCKVYLQANDDSISEVSFEGSGCAISKAAASVMTLVVQGKSRDEAGRLFREFQHLVTTGNANFDPNSKLAAFAGVHKFPARVKCALLSWHAMKAALESSSESVSTEGELAA